MEKIIKYSPVIYGILIFLGYFHYWSYYNIFGIEISSFLSIGELLLSFLRLTIPMILIISFLLIYVILGFINSLIKRPNKDKEKNEDNNIDTTNLFVLEKIKIFIKSIKKINIKKPSNIFFLFIDFLNIIASLIFLIIFFGYFIFIHFIITQEDILRIPSFFPIIYGIVWLFIFYSAFIKMKDIINNNARLFLLIIALFGLFLSNIYVYDKITAINTLNGKLKYSISIYTDTDTINSNKDLIYIGRTNNYTFLRNIKNNKNEIIKNDIINKLILKDKVKDEN